MKIRLSYEPSETARAERIKQIIKALFPTARMKESENHPPYRHCYIDTFAELPNSVARGATKK